MKAVLVLEDGTYFPGLGFGVKGETVGEVVFNTSMTGYQEIITDPSYHGQIVTMTYPLIGNYGFNTEDNESAKAHLQGFIVKELCEFPNNWRCSIDTDDFFKQNKIIGLKGIDTRALTQHIRSFGSMFGIISTECGNVDVLLERLKAKIKEPRNLVMEVTAKEPIHIKGTGKRIVLLDLGVKHSILQYLQKHNCDIHILPASSTYEDIIARDPDGIIVSNGPGNPASLPEQKALLKKLIGKKPLFGISLGQLLLGLALGGSTYKLKYGHHGANHPVKDFATGRCYITSQNHNYVLAQDMSDDIEIIQINANDNTVEGFRHKSLPVLGVQYHPEASASSMDSTYIFDDFMKML